MAGFAFACMMGAALLYVPGYPVLRCVGLSRTLALCAAPLICVAFYSLLPVLYYPLSVPCTLASVAGPLFFCAALCLLGGRGKTCTVLGLTRERPVTICGRKVAFDVAVGCAFVLVATLVCALVLWQALPAPDAINPRNDNQTHINLTRAFLDSGKWSSLHTSLHLASPEHMRPRAGDGSFYPAAWNCLVVLVCLASGESLLASMNAVVSVVSCIVFPLGAYALLRALLPGRRSAICLGAIACTGFAHWPWLFVYTGPLYPNQLGIALQMSALALLVLTVGGSTTEASRTWPRLTPVALCSLVALALSHTSTLFSSYVFAVSLLAHTLWTSATGRRRILTTGSLLVAAIALWALALTLPALQNVVGYAEIEDTDLASVLGALATLTIDVLPAQLAIACPCYVGCVVVARRHHLRWLLAPIAFFAVGYVATRADWWAVKHAMTSLWYSDQRRMAANLTIYLMPVCALGLDAIKGFSPDRVPRVGRAVVAALTLAVFIPSLPVGDTVLTTPMGEVAHVTNDRFHEDIYTSDERAFVNEALAVTGPCALVLNAPADGSMWSYGACGLNTYFRTIHLGNETEAAQVIRTRLFAYATDESVRAAIKETDARYVLLLDRHVSHRDGTWLWQFEPRHMLDWLGILGVNDDTPGFTCVLARGDEMRLYRIER